jgi:hypothetical protein
MFKRFALVLSLCAIGCSGANFDVAAFVDDTGCTDNCPDSDSTETDDSAVSTPDTLVDAELDAAIADTNIADTHTVKDTYVPPKDTEIVKDTDLPKDTGTTVCMPKTCAAISAATGNSACGIVQDGCGGTLNCSTCTDITKVCGGSPNWDYNANPIDGALGKPLPNGDPNQCLGTCVDRGQADTTLCGGSNGWKELIACSNPVTIPLTKCSHLTYAPKAGSNQWWCCESTLK